MKKIYLILIICVLLSSCFDLFDPAYWKDGNYRLSTNAGEPSCLYLSNDGIGLLECVKSIGSNKEYIIATQISRKGKVYYWIIKKKENKYKEKPEGPYDLKQFTEIKKSLLISDLNFESEFGKKKNWIWNLASCGIAHSIGIEKVCRIKRWLNSLKRWKK